MRYKHLCNVWNRHDWYLPKSKPYNKCCATLSVKMLLICLSILPEVFPENDMLQPTEIYAPQIIVFLNTIIANYKLVAHKSKIHNKQTRSAYIVVFGFPTQVAAII